MNALIRMQSEAEDGAIDPFVREWMKQLRELAYDAEDRIDLYLLYIKCPGGGVCIRLKHLVQTLFSRRRLAAEISGLRVRASQISERHARYGVNWKALHRYRFLSSTSMLTTSAPMQALSLATHDAGHRQIIGLDDQVDNLANRMKASSDAERHFKVFSIVGFSGVGKTTLAMEVSRLLEADFPYQAKVSVSQAFDPSRDLKPLLKRVLEQIVKTTAASKKGIREQGSLGNINSLDLGQLAQGLKDRLENQRYLVVIDDVWTIRAWEAIQSVLPENNCGSRIIVTTRMEIVAKACSPAGVGTNCIHYMQPLKMEESKLLFCHRVFGSVDCPVELKEVMGNTLKICGGIPLAIISISSILVGYKSPECRNKWEMICRSIGSQMESNPNLEGMRQIVTLSFNHLPHELKDCMMYLSIFPEDYVIRKDRLLCRWIAEGLISGKRGLTQIEVAESYLDELLSRNMIDEARLFPQVRTPWYRVHDLLLEIMVSRSLEDNFVTLQGGLYDGLSHNRIRRLSIHGNMNSADTATKRKGEEVNMQHARSLSIFRSQGHNLLDQLGKFTLLRVLDMEDCESVTNKHVRYACQLHLLKFLSFKGTNISMVPPQVGNLEHLQTLNVFNTLLDELPETITKLERLQFLEFSNKNYWDIRWQLTRGISKMKALRHVVRSRLGNDAQVAREVGELEQLQTITIFVGPGCISEEVLQELALSLSKRHSLRWLSIGDISEKRVLNFLHRLPTPPRLLRALRINGEMDGLPSWIGTLTYLVHFSLLKAELVSGQIFGALCDLPNLKTLRVLWKCYSANEIVACRSHKFPMLNYLQFAGDLPKVIRLEKGSMEKLEFFELNISSRELDTSIIGIDHLINLKKIMVKGFKDNRALNHALEQLKAENDRRPKSDQIQVAVTYIDE